MSRLFLLRHANAAWAEPGGTDFDRPLADTGWREAETIAGKMVDGGFVPERIVCSPARRAIETWKAVAQVLRRKAGEALMSQSLYGSEASAYLNAVRINGDTPSLLLIGHNPMIEDLALALSTRGDETAETRLSKGFPTAGFAAFSFQVELYEASLGDARLDAFLTPSGA